MKAYRKLNGNIVEIRVDIDREGNPILPPNTTVQPKPEVLEGHYLDLVRGEWEQFPIPVKPEPTLEQLQNEACDELSKYKDWVLDQPVEFDGVLFDADETARVRILGAVNAYQVSEVLPQAWVTFDNGVYMVSDYEQIKGLSMVMYGSFNDRFFFVSSLRNQILAAKDKATLEAIKLPVVGYLPGEEPEEVEDEESSEG